MSKKLVFAVEYAEIVKSDEFLTLCDIDLFHLGKNRNNTRFEKENVEKCFSSLYNKPIVAIYNSPIKSMATDVKSHAENEREETEREQIGVIPMPELSNPRWITTEDGYERLRLTCVIWNYYCPDIIRILKDNGDTSKVSVELLPIEVTKEESGCSNIISYNFLSVSLISKKTECGMTGSNLNVIKYSYEEMIKQTDKYLSTFSKKIEEVNIFEKIKNKKGGNKMEHRELERQLWAELSNKMYTLGKETYHKYYIEAIYDTHIIVFDNEKNEKYKIKYHVDESGKATIDFTTIKPLEDDLKKFSAVTYAKEEIGTETALKVDKSKESMSDDAWGGIDKSMLRKRVIKAKNFKTIAKDVFMELREGWEDGKESSLKYPIMQLDGDSLVYNRSALGSAKAYADKNNMTEVLDKLKSIYKKMGLEFELKEDKPKAMYEIGKSCYEDDEDDDKDEPKEEVDDKNKEDDEKEVKTMSSDENVDGVATAELLNKEAETNKELAKEDNKTTDEIDFKAKCGEYELKFAEMEKELYSLRQFKCDTEEEKKEFEVGKVMAEVDDVLPNEKKDEFKKIAKEKFSYSTISQWSNLVKAEAFKFTKASDKQLPYIRMGLWGNEIKEQSKPTNSMWDKI